MFQQTANHVGAFLVSQRDSRHVSSDAFEEHFRDLEAFGCSKFQELRKFYFSHLIKLPVRCPGTPGHAPHSTLMLADFTTRA